MASVQCYKPSEQSCNQGHHSSSLGQKVSEVASWAFKSSSETKNHATHSTTGYTQTQCYGKTQTDCTDQGMAKTQTNHCYSQTQIHNSNQGMSHGHGLTHTHSVDQNKVHGCGQTQTTCTDQNKAHGHCQTETQTHATNGMATCKGRSKKRGEQKKRGLFQRIKEGIAGDSSSSESDSDDDNSGKRKN